MMKSTFNLLRRIDKMAICMYNLSDYVLVTITAGQDVAGGEAEVESFIFRATFLLFFVVRLIKVCATLLSHYLCLLFFSFFFNNDYMNKDCLACVLGIMAQRSARNCIGFISYSISTTYNIFTGI